MRKNWRHLWIGLLLCPAAGLCEPAPMTGDAAARLEGFKRCPTPVTAIHKDPGMLTNRTPAVAVQGTMPLASNRSSVGGPQTVTGAVDAAGRRLSTGGVLSDEAGKIKGGTGAATLRPAARAKMNQMIQKIDRIIEATKSERHSMTNAPTKGFLGDERHDLKSLKEELKPPEPSQDRHRK